MANPYLPVIGILLPYLDTQSTFALRLTCKNFFCSKLHASILAKSHIPLPEKWSAARCFQSIKWFLGIPPFYEAIGSFPFFRVCGAQARIVQGALRMLAMHKYTDGLFLVGTVQPSVTWSSKHEVFFKYAEGKLKFAWCSCRNGYVFCIPYAYT